MRTMIINSNEYIDKFFKSITWLIVNALFTTMISGVVLHENNHFISK